MRSVKILKAAAVSMACLGFIIPNGQVFAAGTAKVAKKNVKAPADVALQEGGVLTGLVINQQQKPIDGAVVSIRQGNREVAKTVTNKQGKFKVANLKGGVYEVASANGTGLYRAWAAKTAPPKARNNALVVSGAQVVRGQFGGLDIITLTVLGASITGAVLGGINTSKINDLEDAVDQIPKSN